ncbi:MAG: hypothetical protein WCJ92_01345 [Alphaproteobacteria bacterium]
MNNKNIIETHIFKEIFFMNKTKKHTVLKKAMLLLVIAVNLNIYAADDTEALDHSRPLPYTEVEEGFSNDTEGSKNALLFFNGLDKLQSRSTLLSKLKGLFLTYKIGDPEVAMLGRFALQLEKYDQYRSFLKIENLIACANRISPETRRELLNCPKTSNLIMNFFHAQLEPFSSVTFFKDAAEDAALYEYETFSNTFFETLFYASYNTETSEYDDERLNDWFVNIVTQLSEIDEVELGLLISQLKQVLSYEATFYNSDPAVDLTDEESEHSPSALYKLNRFGEHIDETIRWFIKKEKTERSQILKEHSEKLENKIAEAQERARGSIFNPNY